MSEWFGSRPTNTTRGILGRMHPNAVAVRALRHLISGAAPCTLTISGTEVEVVPSAPVPQPWPNGLPGLEEERDGPWPSVVTLECRWEGGQTTLELLGDSGGKGELRVGVHVGLRGPRHALLYTNLSKIIAGHEDVEHVPVFGTCYLLGRGDASERRRRAEALQAAITESGLPLLTATSAEIAQLRTADGELIPSARVAFERIVKVALYKLDFMSRGTRALQRGTPLHDLAAMGLATSSEPDAEDDDDAQDELAEEDTVEVDEAAKSDPFASSKNLILYGPPGTGKTHRLRQDFMPRFNARVTSGLAIELVDELSWFQVLAAALAEGDATPVQLREHPFVKAKYQGKDHKAPIGSRIWATLQTHTIEESETVSYGKRSGQLVFDKRADGTWFFPAGVPEDIAELVGALRPRAKETREGNVFLTFHQSYAYEDFIEGIRPKTLDAEDGPGLTYELEDGVFLRAAQAAVRAAGFDGTVDDLCRRPAGERAALFTNAPGYGVFIDEINRGNVSRIFGELITLLEDDKRLGAEQELIVTLPYSRRRFGVPANLYVVGTMNTADRSVEALDAALRRRFAFIECAPDAAQLDGIVVEGGVEIAPMLRTINARIELLLDRDHRIGHAFLLPLRDEKTLAKLKDIFARKLMPLLAEYFYADLGRIGLVLGEDFVQRVGSGQHAVRLAPSSHEAAGVLADRTVYRLTPIESISTGHFRAIYES